MSVPIAKQNTQGFACCIYDENIGVSIMIHIGDGDRSWSLTGWQRDLIELRPLERRKRQRRKSGTNGVYACERHNLNSMFSVLSERLIDTYFRGPAGADAHIQHVEHDYDVDGEDADAFPVCALRDLETLPGQIQCA